MIPDGRSLVAGFRSPSQPFRLLSPRRCRFHPFPGCPRRRIWACDTWHSPTTGTCSARSGSTRHAGIGASIPSSAASSTWRPARRHVKSGTEKGNKYHHLVLLARNIDRIPQPDRALLARVHGGVLLQAEDRPANCSARTRGGSICLSACLAGRDSGKDRLRGTGEDASARVGFYRDLFGEGNFYPRTAGPRYSRAAHANGASSRSPERPGLRSSRRTTSTTRSKRTRTPRTS